MEQITRAVVRGEAVRVGVDLAKRVIQVHAVDGAGHVLCSRALARDKFIAWCAQLSAGCNRLWFRLAHLAAIAVVVLQTWLGQFCPLTTLESWLRVQAGTSPYKQSFIEHWLQKLIYHEAPPWIFTLAYTAFALLVLLAWWRYPPSCGSCVRVASSEGPGVAAPNLPAPMKEEIHDRR